MQYKDQRFIADYNPMRMEPERKEGQISDPDWAKSYRETHDVPWYIPDIADKVTPEVSELKIPRSFPGQCDG